MMNLRDSHILNHKQNLEWNWLLIATILKVMMMSPSTTNSVVDLFSSAMLRCGVFSPSGHT